MKPRNTLIVMLFAFAALTAGCSGASSKMQLGDEGKRSSEVQKELRDRVVYRLGDR